MNSKNTQASPFKKESQRDLKIGFYNRYIYSIETTTVVSINRTPLLSLRSLVVKLYLAMSSFVNLVFLMITFCTLQNPLHANTPCGKTCQSTSGCQSDICPRGYVCHTPGSCEGSFLMCKSTTKKICIPPTSRPPPTAESSTTTLTATTERRPVTLSTTSKTVTPTRIRITTTGARTELVTTISSTTTTRLPTTTTSRTSTTRTSTATIVNSKCNCKCKTGRRMKRIARRCEKQVGCSLRDCKSKGRKRRKRSRRMKKGKACCKVV